MGLLSRIATFFHIRVNAALDKAEDPRQVLDYAYTKQQEQLILLKRAVVEAATNEKRLEQLQQQLITKVNTLSTQARQALGVEREDLARLALQKKEDLLPQINAYEQQLAEVREQKERLIALERATTARIEAFRTQKDMVKAQYTAAQAQVKINETLTGLSKETGEMNLALQRAQEKILSTQARANALEALLEQGALAEATLPGSGDQLDRELQRIVSEQSVESQLLELKQQLQLNGPQIQQKRLEGPASE